MKSRLTLLFAGALGAGLPLVAQQTAQQTDWMPPDAGWSSEISGGYLKDAETGAIIIGGGYQAAPQHYFGLEGLFFRADEHETLNNTPFDSKLDASVLFAVYRYRYPWGATGRFALDAGGGVGLSWMKITGDLPAFNVHVSDKSKSDLAGELFTGVEWRFSQNLTAHVRYRWFRVKDTEFFGVKSDYTDQLIEGGLSYHF